MPKISPCLWFNNNAEEAVDFYRSVFKDVKIIDTMHNTESNFGKTGSVLAITFSLFGQEFLAMNGGPDFPFTNAVSLMVLCDTQEEIDRYWDALLKGGKPQACGWLHDKFGLPWQITPPILQEMLRDKNKTKADAVMKAMMEMVKIDIAALKKAYESA